MVEFIKQNVYMIWRQLRKGILQVFTANVINKIVSMLSNMILVRMLAQNQYGILSYAGNIYSYACLIMGFGLAVGALQFGTENQGRLEEYRFYRYCAGAGMLANLLIIAIFSFALLLGELPIGQAKRYVYTYLPLLIIQYLVQLLLNILRSQNQIKTYAKLVTMQTILVSGGTCIGALGGINGVIAAKYIASFAVLFAMGRQTRGIVRSIIRAGKLNIHQKKGLWRYSILNGISSTLNRFLFMIDISMIAALTASARTLAIYKIATLIPNAITFIPQSVVICVVPGIIRHNQDAPWLRKAFKKIFAGMMIFNLFIGVCLIICAPWVIRIIAGEQYLAAAEPFKILVAGYCIAGTFRSLSVNFLAALKAVRCNAVCSFITCMTDVMLNYLFIPRFGMIGAAYGTFLAEVISSLLTFGCLMHMLKRMFAKESNLICS